MSAIATPAFATSSPTLSLSLSLPSFLWGKVCALSLSLSLCCCLSLCRAVLKDHCLDGSVSHKLHWSDGWGTKNGSSTNTNESACQRFCNSGVDCMLCMSAFNPVMNTSVLAISICGMTSSATICHASLLGSEAFSSLALNACTATR